jgi:hypothetical protein
MRPGADGNADDGVMGVGLFLARKCFNVAVALTVYVVHDPSLARLASRRAPTSLPDTH